MCAHNRVTGHGVAVGVALGVAVRLSGVGVGVCVGDGVRVGVSVALPQMGPFMTVASTAALTVVHSTEPTPSRFSRPQRSQPVHDRHQSRIGYERTVAVY